MASAKTTKNGKAATPTGPLTDAERAEVAKKLTTARVALLMRHPFFGNLATRMKIVNGTDWCDTLATDGRNFYYNEQFVKRLTIQETVFGFAHEVLHNVFNHLERREGRDHQLANIAADYADNQILKDEKIGEVPSFMKIFQDDKYRGWAFEQIYADLEKNCTKVSLESMGELLDDHLDNQKGDAGGQDGDGNGKRPQLSSEERDAIRKEMQTAILAAAQAAGAGKVPAGIARMIKQFTEPTMNWREILRMNIQSLVRSNYSFARPNRKSQSCGAVLPGLLNEETIKVFVALDMSGSISNSMIEDFLGEVRGMMDQFAEYEIDVVSFDTRVYNHAVFSSDNGEDIMTYEAKGGGGTDFMSVWDFMKEEEIVPKIMIMFTDMYPGGSWGDPDYCETIFVGHGTTSIVAPFGTTLYYSE